MPDFRSFVYSKIKFDVFFGIWRWDKGIRGRHDSGRGCTHSHVRPRVARRRACPSRAPMRRKAPAGMTHAPCWRHSNVNHPRVDPTWRPMTVDRPADNRWPLTIDQNKRKRGVYVLLVNCTIDYEWSFFVLHLFNVTLYMHTYILKDTRIKGEAWKADSWTSCLSVRK